jgi:hypothetical protein
MPMSFHPCRRSGISDGWSGGLLDLTLPKMEELTFVVNDLCECNPRLVD